MEENFIKTVKTQLKYILDANKVNIVNEIVLRVHNIMFHVTYFLKLFLIHQLDMGSDAMLLNEQLILDIMHVITTTETTRGRPKTITNQIVLLQNFYNMHYNKILEEEQKKSRTNLSQILNYCAEDLIKNIKQNVIENYMSYVNKLVNLKYGLHESKNKKELGTELKKVKYDLTSSYDEEYTSDAKYNSWICHTKGHILPERENKDKPLLYDLKQNFHKYFQCMIYINQQLEKMAKNKGKEYKLPNTCILKNGFVPNYITIDTSGIIEIFDLNGQIENEETGKAFNKANIRLKISEYKYVIWETFFKQKYSKPVKKKNKKWKKKIINIFNKKGYNFIGMIKTDGIGVSILYEKISKQKNANDNKKRRKSKTKKEKNELKEFNSFKYIEKDDNIDLIDGKNVVINDPGHSDLLHMYSEQKKIKKFRYTVAQRQHEMKTRKYAKIRKKMYKEEINDQNISVQERFEFLSWYNLKSCDYRTAFWATHYKSFQFSETLQFFSNQIHRKLRLNSYINKQKSESKMLNAFEKKMGSPENTVIVSGDYSKSTKKGNAPAKNVGLLKLFRQRGYQVFLINEYNTSKTCSHCHGKVEPFLKRKKKDKFNVWGLVRCTNDNCLQGTIHKPGFSCSIHNRDTNACKNMLSQIKHIQEHGKKQKIFRNPWM